jgi:hypothetical protein
MEHKGHELTFQGYFQGSNADQYQGPSSPSQGGLGHYRYLNRHVYPLSRDQRATYVAATVQRILGDVNRNSP